MLNGAGIRARAWGGGGVLERLDKNLEINKWGDWNNQDVWKSLIKTF